MAKGTRYPSYGNPVGLLALAVTSAALLAVAESAAASLAKEHRILPKGSIDRHGYGYSSPARRPYDGYNDRPYAQKGLHDDHYHTHVHTLGQPGIRPGGILHGNLALTAGGAALGPYGALAYPGAGLGLTGLYSPYGLGGYGLGGYGLGGYGGLGLGGLGAPGLGGLGAPGLGGLGAPGLGGLGAPGLGGLGAFGYGGLGGLGLGGLGAAGIGGLGGAGVLGRGLGGLYGGGLGTGTSISLSQDW